MASLTNYKKITRDTIADGDNILSDNLETAVDNDDLMIAEANQTYDTVTDVYNTVNANSAKNWNNALISGFNKNYVDNTTFSTGTGKFDAIFNIENTNDSCISAYVKDNKLIIAESDDGIDKHKDKSYLNYNKNLFDTTKSKVDDATVLLNTTRQNYNSYKTGLRLSATNSFIGITDVFSGMLSAANSAVLLSVYDGTDSNSVSRIIDNSYVISNYKLGSYSVRSPYDKSIAINSYNIPMYIGASAISIKGTYSAYNKSVSIGNYPDTNCLQYVTDESIFMFSTASQPVTARDKSQTYFQPNGSNPLNRTTSQSSISFNNHFFAIDDCCINVGAYDDPGTSFTNAHSAINVVSEYKDANITLYQAVQNKSIAVLAQYYDEFTRYNSSILPTTTTSGENLSLQSYMSNQCNRVLNVKGNVIHDYNVNGLQDVILHRNHAVRISNCSASVLTNLHSKTLRNVEPVQSIDNSIIHCTRFDVSNLYVNDCIISNSTIESIYQLSDSFVSYNSTVHGIKPSAVFLINSDLRDNAERGNVVANTLAVNSTVILTNSTTAGNAFIQNSYINNNCAFNDIFVVKSNIAGNVNGKTFHRCAFINASSNSNGMEEIASATLCVNTFIPDKSVGAFYYGVSTAISSTYRNVCARVLSPIAINSNFIYSYYNASDISFYFDNTQSQAEHTDSKDAKMFFVNYYAHLGEYQRMCLWNGNFTIDNDCYMNYIKFTSASITETDTAAAQRFIGSQTRFNINTDAGNERRLTFSVI